jgi:cadmium resistance protein CadD (predicted permease)
MIELIALLGAIATKLTTSTDDLIWLPKLLEDENSTYRHFIGIVYILALSIVVLVAYLFSYLALEVFFGAYVGWFSVISSLSLIGYGIYLYKNQDDENDDFAEDKSYKPLQEKLKTAFIVSLIGSFDELAVFVVLFATNKVTIFSLLVGTIIAGILVFWISNQASQINPIKEKLAKIPEGWIIIGAGILALVLGLI